MSDFMLTDTYDHSVEELKNFEKTIRGNLKELKNNIDTSQNTFSSENTIRRNLDSYHGKWTSFNSEYTKSKIAKNALPEKEFNRRLNEIQQLKDNFDKVNREYEDALNSKYKFVIIL